MSDSGNPFSESASRSKLSGGARRALWTLAVAVGLLVAALITLALFTKQQWLARARAQARLGQAEQDSRAAQALAAARLEAINQLQQRVAGSSARRPRSCVRPAGWRMKCAPSWNPRM